MIALEATMVGETLEVAALATTILGDGLNAAGYRDFLITALAGLVARREVTSMTPDEAKPKPA